MHQKTHQNSPSRKRNALLLAYLCLVIPALQGCVAAAVATGAAAGYYAYQDERRVGQIIDDASINAAVKTRLIRDPKISGLDFNVDTRHGVVTLYGSVSSQEIEQRAIELTKGVEGVKKIVSKVTIVSKD